MVINFEITARVKALKEMDLYILNTISNEDCTYYWILDGVIDRSDIDDLISLAEDEEAYNDVLELFERLKKQYGA